jgi:hypothetical protein
MTESKINPWLGRLTPYEMVFGEAAFEDTLFPAITTEAREHGVDPALREQFGFLPAASDLVRRMVPDEATPEVIEQARDLLYQAYNFRRAGRVVLACDTPVIRYLVEAGPSLGDWEFSLPAASVYLQLPAHLFWASVSVEAAPEPVDGIFLTAVSAEDPLGPPYRRVNALMVLGMRPDRAGFSVASFDTEVGPGIPADWMAAEGRESGEDFANVLPGGELSGLYSITTAAEGFKLIGSLAWYIDSHPDAVDVPAPVVWDADDPPVRRSRLDISTVRLERG